MLEVLRSLKSSVKVANKESRSDLLEIGVVGSWAAFRAAECGSLIVWRRKWLLWGSDEGGDVLLVCTRYNVNIGKFKLPLDSLYYI